MILFYSSKSCRYCQELKPTLIELQSRTPNLTILEIDINSPDGLDLFKEAGITITPTLQFYKNNQLVEVITGKDLPRIYSVINRL